MARARGRRKGPDNPRQVWNPDSGSEPERARPPYGQNPLRGRLVGAATRLASVENQLTHLRSTTFSNARAGDARRLIRALREERKKLLREINQLNGLLGN